MGSSIPQAASSTRHTYTKIRQTHTCAHKELSRSYNSVTLGTFDRREESIPRGNIILSLQSNPKAPTLQSNTKTSRKSNHRSINQPKINKRRQRTREYLVSSASSRATRRIPDHQIHHRPHHHPPTLTKPSSHQDPTKTTTPRTEPKGRAQARF